MTKPSPPRTDDATSNGDAHLFRGLGQLNDALAEGPQAVAKQLRALIMLSHLNPAPTPRRRQADQPVSVKQARLIALANIADTFTEKQLQALILEASMLDEIDIRLYLVARFALHLQGTPYRRAIIKQIWAKASSIQNPALRVETLYELAPLLILSERDPKPTSPLARFIRATDSLTSIEARTRALIALSRHLPRTSHIHLFEKLLHELDDNGNDSVVTKSLTAIAMHLPPELIDDSLQLARAIQRPTERVRALFALARTLDDERLYAVRFEALDIIDDIESEDERAEALIGLAPDLEFLAERGLLTHRLMERIAPIIIMIGRRHIRARVLVALAPYLTPDLLGEAIASVNSLDNERDRALMLAQLAPSLPPDMVVASLAVAHSMREQDSRAQALVALSQFAPSSASGQTMLDALAAASNLTHPLERVQTLVKLVTVLPDELRDQALVNALNTIEGIRNPAGRTRALSLLGDHLPIEAANHAYTIARSLDDPEHRIHALLGLISSVQLTDEDAIRRQLLTDALSLPLEYKRARALASICPFIAPADLVAVEAAVDKFEDPIDRVAVYIAVVQNLPREERDELVMKAWHTLQQIEYGYDRASAIASIAPLLPDSERHTLLELVISTILEIDDDYDKASAINILSSFLNDPLFHQPDELPDIFTALEFALLTALKIPQITARQALLAQGVDLWRSMGDSDRTFTLWKILLKQMSHMPLSDILLCVSALLPLAHQFAGGRALEDVAHLLGVR